MYYKETELDDLEGETWVDAIGFDGIYEVSNLGRIKSLGRWVSNGKSERWVKEKIRKQVLVSDGRLTCPLQGTSINLAATIFLSFNMNEPYDPQKQCVMHKNKLKFDNRLENLKVESISESHRVNHEKGLLPHLKLNNNKKREEYLKIKERKCRDCKEVKEISLFRYGSRQCLQCRGLQKKEYYKKKKSCV